MAQSSKGIMDPFRKSDWIGLLFSRDLSGASSRTDKKLDLQNGFCRSSFGSAVPEQSHVNTWAGS